MERFFFGKNVLIISPEPWDHLFISKHHYAIELSQNNKVFFLNPPGSDFQVKSTRYNNLYEITYTAFAYGLRFFPGFIQRWFMRRKFQDIEQLIKVNIDCVWSFDNSVFFDFSFLPDHIFTISHIVDYSQDFQLAKAARTADLCLGVSQNIVDLLQDHNTNTNLIPHGIAANRTKYVDVVLPGEQSLKAIFAGNLKRKHFDKKVLLKLADDFPHVDFIFYGSGGEDWDRKKNTFYPGIVESELLVNYLEKADVLLLPYKVDEFPLELTNSHKVLDYLQSGTVIIASWLADYSSQPNLLKMVENNNDFSIVFSEVVANLYIYNSKDSKEMRRRVAFQNTYAKRLEEIEILISRLMSKK
jgi:glycosyltransferase involved in cell wall biosynthesis